MSGKEFLAPGRFIDSDAPTVIDFARATAAGGSGPLECAIKLYNAIRDGIVYDLYIDFSDPDNFRASGVLRAGRGFCVGKAALLSACARAIGIPARVGYADVRNHLTSPRLYELIKTDLFMWHSYADLHLEGNWVKATPAFDAALCNRLGLKALAFDGRSDSLFQPFDPAGRRHMEYVHDRGTFADVPHAAIWENMQRYYPALVRRGGIRGDFRNEAVAATSDQR